MKQNQANPTPPKELLWELFDYEEKTGALFHKKPRFGVTVGTEAGSVNAKGYRRIKIAGKLYLAHRLIYAMHYGDCPVELEVDHADGKASNNRIENLRLATHGQNQANSGVYKCNPTGQRGVHWHKQHRKYTVTIQCNNVKRHVGLFKTIGEAKDAYRKAYVSAFGEFAKVTKEN